MTFQNITLLKLTNMKHLISILALAALFIYIACYTAPKAFDKSYDNQDTMIMLHKLSIEE